MRFYSTTFFCDEGSKLKAHVSEDSNDTWPITIKINPTDEKTSTPEIIIFCDRNQLFMIADSFNQAITKILHPEESEDE